MNFNLEHILLTCFGGVLIISSIAFPILYYSKNNIAKIVNSEILNTNFHNLEKIFLASIIYTSGIFVEYAANKIFSNVVRSEREVSFKKFNFDEGQYLLMKIDSVEKSVPKIFYQCKGMVYRNKNFF